MTIRSGTVYLIGAGPGDPGLITVRGLEILRRADVVVHDRLIPLQLLDETRADAMVVDAGKAPGDHTLTQNQINALLVEHARVGASVARLKGGDPFVLGRGWEEREACLAEGIPCEIVPGVTSAIAGPAAADIPVTARGIARSFAVVTARAGAAADPFDHLDFEALARLDTLVVMMGVASLAHLVEALRSAGRAPDMPVAIIEHATLPGQRETRGTLETIVALARDAEITSPAVIIVGHVAALPAHPIDRPLAGRRVLVTRPRTASHELAQRLRELGAGVIDCPLIRIKHLEPSDPLWPARLPNYDWIALTSRHGARAFFRALRSAGLDARAFGAARIACVGPTTARELSACGLSVDLVPDTFRAGPLAQAILDASDDLCLLPRVLFPCGTLAREELADNLRAGGALVDRLTVYETILESPDERVRAEISRGLDAVLLASPSAARAIVQSKTGIAEGTLVVCIGPTTADAARRVGLPNVLVADEHSDAGLVATLHETLAHSEAVA